MPFVPVKLLTGRPHEQKKESMEALVCLVERVAYASPTHWGAAQGNGRGGREPLLALTSSLALRWCCR